VLVVARIPLIRASVVTRYLIAAEPAVMRAPAGAVMVALSRWVMTGLPWCQARWKDRRGDAHRPDSDSRAPAGRPGELARLGEVTGEAGVTIHGLAAFTGEGRGVVHVLLDDDAVNRKLVGLLGIQVHAGPPMKIEFRKVRLKL